MVYLASDEAYWIHGQAWTSIGEGVRLMQQPKYGTGIYREGGWTVDTLKERMRQVYFGQLESFGLGKPPYAFYEGLDKGEEKKP